MAIVKTKKSKNKKVVNTGRIYIQSTFNNTIITVTDATGNSLAAASAGSLGFKGARKTTPYAAQLTMQTVLDKVKTLNDFSQAQVFVSGVGNGREAAIKAIGATGISVSLIKDTTPVPHNGCRPKKLRRV